jgi:hypothetical protein
MAELDWRRMLGMVGEAPFAPPAPQQPDLPTVFPVPRAASMGQWTPIPSTGIDISGAPPGAARLLAEALARARIDVGPGGAAYPVTFTLTSDVSGGPEAYRVQATIAGATVSASTDAGLARGAATARQLLRRVGDGLEVLIGKIDDHPVVPLRMLAGWGLYRDHRMEWALEIAAEAKFNRVLYNWWTATADESMGPREAELVTAAREIGVELVVELRRQAMGPAFSIRDKRARATLLAHFDDAADRGFRSFGFLFDDTDHDPFEDELGFLGDLVAHLTERLGEEPEFYFCPRFYWFPGQMDYSWMAAAMGGESADGRPSMAPMLGTAEPRSVEAAVARQEDYQDQLAAALPDRTEVYLANWWSGTPDTWASELSEGWTDRLGREPVFWDNQQQNDYRAAVVLPIPLHQRPTAFARRLRGYTLNSGVPLSAYAPASATAGAWAWNPDGYDPATAFGAAIERFYGPAAFDVTNALAQWGTLLGELMAPRVGMENHYRGLRNAVRAGTTDQVTIALDAVAGALARASGRLPADAHPLAHDGLAELTAEVERLRLDLELAACADPDRAGDLLAAIEQVLVSRLPPVPDLATQARHADPSSPLPGVSWYLHFVAGPLRAGPNRLAARFSVR